MKFLMAMFLLALSCQALSCPLKLIPYEPLESYDQIVTGQVVGIRLTSYLERRIEENLDYPNWVSLYGAGNIAKDYELEVLVDRTISGPEVGVVKTTVGGCGVIVPSMAEFAILFVSGYRAIPIFSSEGTIHSDTLMEVGKWKQESKGAVIK